MLAAMLTVFLLGGGLMGGSLLTPAHVERIGERIEAVIPDSARRENLGRILDELETEVERFDQVFFDSSDRLRDLYLDHNAGSAQIKTELEALNVDWYLSQQRHIELREQLKGTITAEEWSRVFADR